MWMAALGGLGDHRDLEAGEGLGFGAQQGLQLRHVFGPAVDAGDGAQVGSAPQQHESRPGVEAVAGLQFGFGFRVDQGGGDAAGETLQQFRQDHRHVMAFRVTGRIAGEKQQAMVLRLSPGVELGQAQYRQGIVQAVEGRGGHSVCWAAG
jgi:hypothetical protein